MSNNVLIGKVKSSCSFQGVELKTIVNLYTCKSNASSKSEDTLLRYLTFYCNLADIILAELIESGDRNNNHCSWVHEPTPQRRGAVYFEFFDHVYFNLRLSSFVLNCSRINNN